MQNNEDENSPEKKYLKPFCVVRVGENYKTVSRSCKLFESFSIQCILEIYESFNEMKFGIHSFNSKCFVDNIFMRFRFFNKFLVLFFSNIFCVKKMIKHHLFSLYITNLLMSKFEFQKKKKNRMQKKNPCIYRHNNAPQKVNKITTRFDSASICLYFILSAKLLVNT